MSYVHQGTHEMYYGNFICNMSSFIEIVMLLLGEALHSMINVFLWNFYSYYGINYNEVDLFRLQDYKTQIEYQIPGLEYQQGHKGNCPYNTYNLLISFLGGNCCPPISESDSSNGHYNDKIDHRNFSHLCLLLGQLFQKLKFKLW